LNADQSKKLKSYYQKKLKQQEEKNTRNQELEETLNRNGKTRDDFIPDILASDKYLSSEHERESDSIRNIIEENDEIYQDLNYMESFADIASDPKKKEFLKNFQDELDR
jgi:hypothetical protein